MKRSVNRFGKSQTGINNSLVIVMGTKKSPKVIVTNVIGPFEGPKMIFNLSQFLQCGVNF